MAKYAIFFNLKDEALARMIENPGDRAAAVSETMKQVGGKLESYYWMFGQYDGIVIVEAPDSTSAAAVSVAVSSSGAFSHVETHELIDASQLGAVLAKAKSVRETYRAPGA